MTWSASVFVEGVEDGYSQPCRKCAHNSCCNISSIADTIGPVLTSVDTGSDGHMASGEAVLKCNGFEPVPETSEAEGSGEDSGA